MVRESNGDRKSRRRAGAPKGRGSRSSHETREAFRGQDWIRVSIRNLRDDDLLLFDCDCGAHFAAPFERCAGMGETRRRNTICPVCTQAETHVFDLYGELTTLEGSLGHSRKLPYLEAQCPYCAIEGHMTDSHVSTYVTASHEVVMISHGDHNGGPALPLAANYDVPDAIGLLSPRERAKRTVIGDEYCGVDRDTHFLRGVLALPIHGSPHPVCIRLWAQVSVEVAQELNGGPKNGAVLCGELANEVEGHTNTCGLKVTIEVPEDRLSGRRFHLMPVGHPLYREQQEGIELAQAWRCFGRAVLSEHSAAVGTFAALAIGLLTNRFPQPRNLWLAQFHCRVFAWNDDPLSTLISLQCRSQFIGLYAATGLMTDTGADSEFLASVSALWQSLRQQRLAAEESLPAVPHHIDPVLDTTSAKERLAHMLAHADELHYLVHEEERWNELDVEPEERLAAMAELWMLQNLVEGKDIDAPGEDEADWGED